MGPASCVSDLREGGLSDKEATVQRAGPPARLDDNAHRAVVLLPLLLASDVRSSGQCPLTAVVIRGTVASTLTALLVLPAICRLCARPTAPQMNRFGVTFIVLRDTFLLLVGCLSRYFEPLAERQAHGGLNAGVGQPVLAFPSRAQGVSIGQPPGQTRRRTRRPASVLDARSATSRGGKAPAGVSVQPKRTGSEDSFPTSERYFWD